MEHVGHVIIPPFPYIANTLTYMLHIVQYHDV